MYKDEARAIRQLFEDHQRTTQDIKQIDHRSSAIEHRLSVLEERVGIRSNPPNTNTLVFPFRTSRLKPRPSPLIQLKSVHQVLSITELVQAILKHLTTQQLLLCQRVSKTFRDTIKASIDLQRALFLTPSTALGQEGWPTCNPLFDGEFLRNKGFYVGNTIVRIPPEHRWVKARNPHISQDETTGIASSQSRFRSRRPRLERTPWAEKDRGGTCTSLSLHAMLG